MPTFKRKGPFRGSQIPRISQHSRSMISRTLYNQESNTDCICRTIVSDKFKPGYIGTYKSNAMRIAEVLASTHLGGTIQFGNSSEVTALGTREGQPGGTPRIPRNKF